MTDMRSVISFPQKELSEAEFHKLISDLGSGSVQMPKEPPQKVLEAIYGMQGEQNGSDGHARIIYSTIYRALSE